MAGVKRDGHAIEVEREEAERLSADDMAGRTSEEFLSDALLACRLKAVGGALVAKGTCSNCAERCAPQAVYCDADCRSDHELRLAAQARTGRSE